MRGFHSIPNLPRGRIEVIEFCGGSCDGVSVHGSFSPACGGSTAEVGAACWGGTAHGGRCSTGWPTGAQAGGAGGVAMQGHGDVLVVRIGEGRRWTSGAGQGRARCCTSWWRTSRRSCSGGRRSRGRRAAHRKGTGRAERRRQHQFVDVKEEGEQARKGNLGPATWAAGM
jgi:hypothetical protein